MSKLSAALKLLTPELRKKIAAKQEECYKLAEKHFKRKFERPTVRFDIKNHDGGRANSGTNTIRYNLILLVENEEDFLKNTVPHEVAHLINRAANVPAPGKKKLMPHGKEWKAVMREVLKLTPSVTHSYDTSSIERPVRRKQGSKARVNSAIAVIRSVLTRVDKKFTPTEQKRFKALFNNLQEELLEDTFAEAA